MNRPESLRDTVYRHLIQKIQSGAIRPGDKINESVICSELSLSRTPAREALIKLESEGFLHYTPNRGFTVAEIDDKSRNDVYVIIGALDALATSLAMGFINDGDILRMNELADRMDIAIKYKNYPNYFKSQTEFHDVYISKCNNSRLISILGELRRNFYPQTYITDESGDIFKNLQCANQEHRRIIELFQNKDTAELQNFLQNRHWQNFR